MPRDYPPQRQLPGNGEGEPPADQRSDVEQIRKEFTLPAVEQVRSGLSELLETPNR